MEVPEKGTDADETPKLARWAVVSHLGGENGHFWAHVPSDQAAHALELQARFSCRIRFLQPAIPPERRARRDVDQVPALGAGLIEEDHRKGVVVGWAAIHARVKAAGRARARNLAQFSKERIFSGWNFQKEKHQCDCAVYVGGV